MKCQKIQRETIGFKRFEYTKIMVDTDDTLQDNITLKNYWILIKSVIKHDGKLYPQMF